MYTITLALQGVTVALHYTGPVNYQNVFVGQSTGFLDLWINLLQVHEINAIIIMYCRAIIMMQ